MRGATAPLSRPSVDVCGSWGTVRDVTNTSAAQGVRASGLRALHQNLRPAVGAEVVGALHVACLLGHRAVAIDRLVHTTASLQMASGAVPASPGSSRPSATATAMYLRTADLRSATRPALVLDTLHGNPDERLESSLARAAQWLVADAWTTPVGADISQADDPLTRQAHRYLGLLAGARLSARASTTGPAWVGPRPEDSLDAADQVTQETAAWLERAGSSISAGAAHVISSGMLTSASHAHVERVALAGLAALTCGDGLRSSTASRVVRSHDTLVAHECLRRAGAHQEADVCLGALSARLSRGFPAWWEVGTGREGLPSPVTVAAVLVAKRARAARRFR